MNWKIEYYKKENGEIPVLDYLTSLPSKLKAKAFMEIELLEKYGIDLKEPYTKAIEGKKYKGIFELRIKFSNNISRIFYFCATNNAFVLLNGYTKKSNKTDKKELFSQQFLFYSIKSAFNAKLITEVTSGFDSYYKVI